MSVSESEKSLRRRILFNAIPTETPDNIVQQALELLENEFGSEPEIRYVQLCSRLRESIDHKAFGYGSLLGRMVMLRNKPLEQLGPDPYAQGAALSQKRPVGTVGREMVFNTMLQFVSDSVVKMSPGESDAFRQRFLENIAALKLSPECGRKLVSWSKNKSIAPAISGTDEELHRILNTGFVWLCEKYGPVEADKILLMAVKKAEQLPESFEFPPRNFL